LRSASHAVTRSHFTPWVAGASALADAEVSYSPRRAKLMGKVPERIWLTKFHARIYDVIPNALTPGIQFGRMQRMPLSGAAYDPDTLAMLYRALDAALHRVVPDVVAVDKALQQSIREKLARALIRAYEGGERDPELLAIIAVQSYQRES
jgi:hypothetical protein